MAARKHNYRSTGYVDGNTAKELPVVHRYYNMEADTYEDDYEESLAPRRYTEKQRDHRKEARALEKRRPGIDFSSFLFLTVAMAITAYVCIGYLQVRADLTKMNKNIASLESEIMKLKDQNAARVDAIDATLSLDYIYKVATEEYGMVHPNNSQVILYDDVKSNIVRQYGEIPNGTRESLLDAILGD